MSNFRFRIQRGSADFGHQHDDIIGLISTDNDDIVKDLLIYQAKDKLSMCVLTKHSRIKMAGYLITIKLNELGIDELSKLIDKLKSYNKVDRKESHGNDEPGLEDDLFEQGESK